MGQFWPVKGKTRSCGEGQGREGERRKEGAPSPQKSHWTQGILLVIGVRGQERSSKILSHRNRPSL